MDDFQEIMNSLSEKPARSRLDPYQNLIKELLSRNRTYREIAHILFQKCGIRISFSTIHYFVHSRSRSKPKPAKSYSINKEKETVATTAGNEQTKIAIPRKKIPANEEVYHRIAELKQRPALSDRASKLFRYDPDEPLHIIPKARNKGSDE
jgi:IS30 family transposase